MKFAILLAAALLLAGCTPQPPLIRDLKGQSYEAIGATMTQRLLAKSPLGSPESALVSELGRQHFRVKPAKHYAEFSRTRLLCSMVWAVRWDADGSGRLTRLEGQSYAVCA